ncbi:Tubulin polyglutamylase ttll6 [Clydaea vesicula]|uniref:Tubulin polyglutamylase ttll6 n=1 Tax=Clydaea vesicula TaxID=447962 RepID=A0AAD5Y333_9FUNG|nr:Tubulin polyglutamylase ttll6 [Clydaea vesicula]KAJ3397566.1 Tubulin polyglutamylase ttll6 [Lobulomyces angularis]
MSENNTAMITYKTAKKRKQQVINTELCKYEIIDESSNEVGLKVTKTGDLKWSIFWIDTGVSIERILEMEPIQKINHFPGMQEICRKNYLARNLSRLNRMFPKDYNFFPKTYILRDFKDLSDFKVASSSVRSNAFIAKPERGCQGMGFID